MGNRHSAAEISPEDELKAQRDLTHESLMSEKEDVIMLLEARLKGQRVNKGLSRELNVGIKSSAQSNEDLNWIIVEDHTAIKRTRYAQESCNPLLKDEILSAVLTFVGWGRWIYVGAVSRRFRGLYYCYCRRCVVLKDGDSEFATATLHNTVVDSTECLKLAI